MKVVFSILIFPLLFYDYRMYDEDDARFEIYTSTMSENEELKLLKRLEEPVSNKPNAKTLRGLLKKNSHGCSDPFAEIRRLMRELSRKIDELELVHKMKFVNDYENVQNVEKDQQVYASFPVAFLESSVNFASRNLQKLEDSSSKNTLQNKLVVRQGDADDDESSKNRKKWSKWSNWSACTVTCGKGREIRWRHCIDPDLCQGIETEMAEKTCQLPECGPGKFFGLFN